MIDLPEGLPAELVPLAWLIGTWEGSGVIDYTAGPEQFAGEFRQRVSFEVAGSALAYSAAAHLIADDAASSPALGSESGFWRLVRPATDRDAGPGLLPALAPGAPRTADDVEALRGADGRFEVEVAMVHSDGICELYLGSVQGPRADLATDAVVRGASTKPYTAASRIYGLVESHLLWVWDIAALDAPLTSHASARLAKVAS